MTNDYEAGQVLRAVGNLDRKMDSMHDELKQSVHKVEERVGDLTVAITGDLHSPGLRDKVERIDRELSSHRKRHSPPRGMPSVSETDITTGQRPLIRVVESDEVAMKRWQVIGSIGVGLIGLAMAVITLLAGK